MKSGEGPLELPPPARPEWWQPLIEKLKQGYFADSAIEELGLTQHQVRRLRDYDPDAEAEYVAAAQAGRWADVTAVLYNIERLVQEGTPVTKAFTACGIDKNRMAVYLRNNKQVHERLRSLRSGKGIADHRLLVGYLRIALVEERTHTSDGMALTYLSAFRGLTEALDVTGAEMTVAELRDRCLALVASCMVHRDDMPKVLREQLGLDEEDEE